MKAQRAGRKRKKLGWIQKNVNVAGKEGVFLGLQCPTTPFSPAQVCYNVKLIRAGLHLDKMGKGTCAYTSVKPLNAHFNVDFWSIIEESIKVVNLCSPILVHRDLPHAWIMRSSIVEASVAEQW